MKKIITFALIACTGLLTSAQSPQSPQSPQPSQSSQSPYWQQRVDYTIDVSLHDQEHTLDGFIKMQYSNHSPDTLTFIWIHCWPNAYRNDRTAFSEQLLANGRTDFYFSGKEQKGYINHLDFRVDGAVAVTEDHPQYIDIVRILLPHPLLPEGQITITTPFHVKLPYNFSRGGFTTSSGNHPNSPSASPGNSNTYQITQWYPKPAVYDRKGWHPIPYLDQGEFYSEFGNFDVRITVPKDFIVAATGELQDAPGRQESGHNNSINTSDNNSNTSNNSSNTGSNTTAPAPSASLATGKPHKPPFSRIGTRPGKKTQSETSGGAVLPGSHQTEETKTLRYIQASIHDFAWFADKQFQVAHDTLQVSNGRTIDIYAFYKPSSNQVWQEATRFIKQAIIFRSALIGEYPFNVVTAAEIDMGSPGGMEYPTITGITHHSNARALDLTIEHEVGHNWFYAILGTNERRYPWMDEGINTYYDNRYEALKYPSSDLPHHANNDWILMKIPDNLDLVFLNTLAKEKKDQPISTTSEDFTRNNYDLIAYSKTAYWMKKLEDTLGTPLFDKSMQAYFRTWQFRHPYPEDFRAVIDRTAAAAANSPATSATPANSSPATATRHDLSALFDELDKKGPLTPFAAYRPLKPTLFFNARNTDRFDYINLAPALGYNKYDRFMIGALIHNYNLPPDRFHFLLAPLYATGSHQLNGIGRLSYTWYPSNPANRRTNGTTSGTPSATGSINPAKVETALAGARFSTLTGIDSNGHKLSGGFYKVVPSVRLTFRNPSPRSTRDNWVEWKTFLIGEKLLDHYVLAAADSHYYPTPGKYAFRYLNQFTLNIQDQRVLYPYRAALQFQQAAAFYRINLTGNYFFNYEKGGGMSLRLFGAKFGYIGARDPGQDLTPFEPKLTAVRGSEDYTYSNYFVGRNEFNGFSSQQVMMRDGDLKLRTDLFQGLQGRSDNWVASCNLSSTLPAAIVPQWLPLKVFLDVGTYAAAWKDNPPTSRFLYVGGLELSLAHDIFRFYAPLVYSSDFSDQLKTVADQNKFLKKISFSIDIQNINFQKIFGNIPF